MKQTKPLALIGLMTALIFTHLPLQTAQAGWLDMLGEKLTRTEVLSAGKSGNYLVVKASACQTGITVSDAVLQKHARQAGAEAFRNESQKAEYQGFTFGEPKYEARKETQTIAGHVSQPCSVVTSSRLVKKKPAQSDALQKAIAQFSDPTLKICYRNMPGVSYSRRGDPQGPAITFGNMIGATLGKRVSFVRIGKASERESRLGKFCHMVISTYTWTEARHARAEKTGDVMSEFYFTSGLVARALNPELRSIESMKDFKGRIVITGSKYVGAFVAENFPNAEVVKVRSTSRIVGKMKALIKSDPETPVITVYPEIILAGYPELLPVEVEGVELITESDNYTVLIHSSVAPLKVVVDHVIQNEGVANFYYDAVGR
jgi:hypothetical protein